MILLLALALGWAAAQPAPSIARGEDIEAWELVLKTPPESRGAALLSFIGAWPDSLLAEGAWVALRNLHDPPPLPSHRDPFQRLERSRLAHRAMLERVPAPVPVAPLDPEGEPPPLSKPWSVALHGGLSFSDLQPFATLGLRAGRGPWAVIGRAHLGESAWGELAARLQPATWRFFWAELGADTKTRASARGGASLPLAATWTLDAGLGASIGPLGPDPQARLELAWSPSLYRTRR